MINIHQVLKSKKHKCYKECGFLYRLPGDTYACLSRSAPRPGPMVEPGKSSPNWCPMRNSGGEVVPF